MKLERHATLLFFRNLPSSHRRQAMAWSRVYMAVGILILAGMAGTCAALALRISHSGPDSIERVAAIDHLWECIVCGGTGLAMLCGSVWGIQHMVEARGPTLGDVLTHPAATAAHGSIVVENGVEESPS
jgi:hypothetical protein